MTDKKQDKGRDELYGQHPELAKPADEQLDDDGVLRAGGKPASQIDAERLGAEAGDDRDLAAAEAPEPVTEVPRDGAVSKAKYGDVPPDEAADRK